MTRVKICGVTNFTDALLAAEAGADMLGLNFYPKSPRYLSPEAARMLVEKLRHPLGAACPLLVGLFVNESPAFMQTIMAETGVDCAQLSGDETPDVLLALGGRAFRGIRPVDVAQADQMVTAFQAGFPVDERLPSLLVDAYHPKLYGGTGVQASVEVSLRVKTRVERLMLAGGLTPENVAERVRQVQPWAVDVASGVEMEGDPTRKDAAKVRAFIQAAKAI